MGIGTILESKQILVLATGQGKADAVRAMVEGPVSSMVPATAFNSMKTSPWFSMLQRLMAWNNVNIISSLSNCGSSWECRLAKTGLQSFAEFNDPELKVN